MADKPLAEKTATWEREVGSDPRDPVPDSNPKPPQVAAEDTLVVREDLGPDTYTGVAAGDEVPADLADLPRRSRHSVNPPRRKD
jgi:hypothetical protein